MTFNSISSPDGTVSGGTAGAGGTQNFTFMPINPIAPNQSVTLKLTVNIGTLAAGASQIIYVVTNAVVSGNTNQSAYLNTASALADSVAQVSSNQVGTDVIYSKLLKQVHNLGTAPVASIPQTSPAWANTTTTPGEVLEHCIDFYNYSSMDLSSYIVEDAVPANTTYLAGSAVIRAGSMTNPGTTYPRGTVSYDANTNTVTASGMIVPADGS